MIQPTADSDAIELDWVPGTPGEAQSLPAQSEIEDISRRLLTKSKDEGNPTSSAHSIMKPYKPLMIICMLIGWIQML